MNKLEIQMSKETAAYLHGFFTGAFVASIAMCIVYFIMK